MENYWSVDETLNQVRHLLAEKNAEIERLRDEIFNLKTEVHFDDQAIKSLQEINERLREALKYYADKKEEDWKNGDDGVIARAALKESE